MTSDYAMMTTVRRGFAPRLPSELVNAILEFTNDFNDELKKQCMTHLLGFRGFMFYAIGNCDWAPHLINAANRLSRGLPPDFDLSAWFPERLPWAREVFLSRLNWAREKQKQPEEISIFFPMEPEEDWDEDVRYGPRHAEKWRTKLERNLADNKKLIQHPRVRQLRLQ